MFWGFLSIVVYQGTASAVPQMARYGLGFGDCVATHIGLREWKESHKIQPRMGRKSLAQRFRVKWEM